MDLVLKYQDKIDWSAGECFLFVLFVKRCGMMRVDGIK
jgi:hypothetical protein|tara:strand:+ start:809 stop:922 length:114 start_codon:yes stop_codon:yes gene_type:complete